MQGQLEDTRGRNAELEQQIQDLHEHYKGELQSKDKKIREFKSERDAIF